MNLVATNIHISPSKDHLKEYLEKHPEDQPLRPALQTILESLQHAGQLGSLLQIEKPVENELRLMRTRLKEQTMLGGPKTQEEWQQWKQDTINRLKTHFQKEAQNPNPAQAYFGQNTTKGLTLIDLLSQKYDVVTTNPPYMGSGNMGTTLKQYLEDNYKPGKRDLYAAFILRNLDLVVNQGRIAMVTQQSWMFQRSFSELRANEDLGIISSTSIETLAHLGSGAFVEIGGEVVTTALFTLSHANPAEDHRITAFRLVVLENIKDKQEVLCNSSALGHFVHRPVQKALLAVPHAPLSYWLSQRLVALFSGNPPITSEGFMGWGISSSDNARFLRLWWEIPKNKRWLPHAKGGSYTKWTGLVNHVVDWDADGVKLRQFILERYPYLGENYEIKIRPYTFGKQGWTYSSMAGGCLGVRRLLPEHTTNAKSPALFTAGTSYHIGAVLNSRIASYLLRAIAPALNVDEGYVGILPVPEESDNRIDLVVSECVRLKELFTRAQLTEPNFHSLAADFIGSKALQVCAVLHTLEGFLEDMVFRAFNLHEEDKVAVILETGTPCGWYPLVVGYDELPDSPDCHPIMISSIEKWLYQLPRERFVGAELQSLRELLRAYYEAGPNHQPKTENWQELKSNEETSFKFKKLHFPSETFLERISCGLRIHPISVFWLLKEGIEEWQWRCIPDEQEINRDRLTVLILRLLGHRWPEQTVKGESAPDWADPDGIIPLRHNTREPTLTERIRTHITSAFTGTDAIGLEQEFAELIGQTLEEWIEREFFKHHIKQFRKRPIAWQIQSSQYTKNKKPAFACLIYYHKLNQDTLPKINTQYVRPLRQRHQTELHTIENIPTPSRTQQQDQRRVYLEQPIQELKDLENTLQQITQTGFASQNLTNIISKEQPDKWCSLDGNRPPPATQEEFLQQEQSYNPDINDGVRVNIAPLQKAGILLTNVLSQKDVDKAINDRAQWRADERRWCREGKLPQPGWWNKETNT